FWPRGSARDTPGDETKPSDDGGATLLIATPEGLELLADVLELQTTRVLARRGRHTKDALRRANQHVADTENRKQMIIKSEEQLRRVLVRQPTGADKTLLTDIAGKLHSGPAL